MKNAFAHSVDKRTKTFQSPLKEKVLNYLENPHSTILTPGFFSFNRDLKKLMQLLMLLQANEAERAELYQAIFRADDTNAAVHQAIQTFIVNKCKDNKTMRSFAERLAPFYGFDFDTTDDKKNKALYEILRVHCIKQLKVHCNRVGEQYLEDAPAMRLNYENEKEDEEADTTVDNLILVQSAEKKDAKQLYKRALRRQSDRLSLMLTLLVALGQAAVAACCFIFLGVTQPLFLPIFIAAFLTNVLLLKTDIKDLWRKIINCAVDGKDFFDNLEGDKRRAAIFCTIFASAAGVTLGAMALTMTYSAVFAIMPMVGLAFLATPGIGWCIAGIISIATAIVFLPLMLNSMINFIKGFSLEKIQNYFSLKKNNFDKKDLKGKAYFILSRAFQILLVVASLAITLFAVIGTFGSFKSNIANMLHQFLGMSLAISHSTALIVVFICNLIPELIFNFRNCYQFFNVIPKHTKTYFGYAKEAFGNKEIHLATRCYYALIILLTAIFIGLVMLNGFGNGKTGSQPGGDGVRYLQYFGFTAMGAQIAALVSSTSASISANYQYGMETSEIEKMPIPPSFNNKDARNKETEDNQFAPATP